MTVEAMTKLIEQAQLDEANREIKIRSKIYGYAFGSDGEIVVVEEEARVIAEVIGQLAEIPFMSCSRILEEIAKDYRLASPQIRNRSGRLWTSKSLALLVRPTYASLEENQWGTYFKIRNYPPIVSERAFKTAIARLKRENLA